MVADGQYFCFSGYGFVDFESPMSAETAVKALQSQGVQAQMAKVSLDHMWRLILEIVSRFCLKMQKSKKTWG